MINLLLLSIIDANPHHDPTMTREKRLANSRETLLGEKPARGRKAIQLGVKLFSLLDEAHKAEKHKIMRAVMKHQSPEVQAEWEEEFNKKPRSLRGIAKKHSAAFESPMVKPESTEDQLRRTPKNMQVTAQDMADLEGLFYGNSPKAKRLQNIISELNALGINCSLPPGMKNDELNPKQD